MEEVTGLDPQLLNSTGIDFSQFSFSYLMAGFVFGVVGLYLFRAAKKNVHYPNMGVGVALMIYPYFVHGAWLVWGVGAGLCAAAWWLHKNHIP